MGGSWGVSPTHRDIYLLLFSPHFVLSYETNPWLSATLITKQTQKIPIPAHWPGQNQCVCCLPQWFPCLCRSTHSEPGSSRQVMASVDFDQPFDYIVVGGGTAGLVVANRLTEDSNVRVLVVEAGGDRTADPLVLTPGLVAALYGKEDYDWNFCSPPQVSGTLQ